jgi:hypothetical protein
MKTKFARLTHGTAIELAVALVTPFHAQFVYVANQIGTVSA